MWGRRKILRLVFLLVCNGYVFAYSANPLPGKDMRSRSATYGATSSAGAAAARAKANSRKGYVYEYSRIHNGSTYFGCFILSMAAKR